MSFMPVNLTLWSAPQSSNNGINLPQWWGYLTTTDTTATVLGAGYFNYDPGALLQNNTLQIGDFIYCVCSDGIIDIQITALVPNITTITFSVAAGSVTNASVAANAAIAFSKLAALTSGNILVGSAGNVATSVAMSGDVAIIASGATTIQANAITTAKILAANVTLAKLAAGITPSHIIKFANQVTTVGGAAAEAFVVTGAVAATDRAFVQVVDDGTNNRTALQAVVTNDTLTVTFSGDPGNDLVFNYQLIRAAS